MVDGGAAVVVVPGVTLMVDGRGAEVVVLGGRADVVVTTLVETTLAVAEAAAFTAPAPHALRSPPIDSRPTDRQFNIRLMKPLIFLASPSGPRTYLNVNSNSSVGNTKHHFGHGNDTLLIHSVQITSEQKAKTSETSLFEVYQTDGGLYGIDWQGFSLNI